MPKKKSGCFKGDLIQPLSIYGKDVLIRCQGQGAVWQKPRSVLKVREEWLTKSNVFDEQEQRQTCLPLLLLIENDCAKGANAEIGSLLEHPKEGNGGEALLVEEVGHGGFVPAETELGGFLYFGAGNDNLIV